MIGRMTPFTLAEETSIFGKSESVSVPCSSPMVIVVATATAAASVGVNTPDKMPPTYKYFIEIVDILKNMKPESLTSKSVLVGSTDKIIEDLKQVEAAGISEVILYFNYGLKPHAMVKEQMQRFMADIAPAFDGAHKKLHAA